MAESRINFFNSGIYPEKNAWIEDIDFYLGNSIYSTTAQYIKHAVDLTIKVNAPQSVLYSANINYVKIINDDDNFPVYYFILSYRWLSTSTIEVKLSMDSINTWLHNKSTSDILTDKTNIIREHLDRFEKIPVNRDLYQRKVHKISEGIHPILAKQSDNLITNEINQNFYLIYRTKKDITPSNVNNPVECMLLADESLLIKRAAQNPIVSLQASDLVENTYYYATIGDNPSGVINTDGSFSVVLDQHNAVAEFHRVGDSIQLNRIGYNKIDGYYVDGNSSAVSRTNVMVLTNIVNLRISTSLIDTYTDIMNMTPRFYYSGVSGDLKTIPFKDLDRTDNRIVKIIKLPYFPTPFEYKADGTIIYLHSVWSFKESALFLKDLNTSFKSNIGSFNVNIDDSLRFNTSGLNANSEPNILAESKLFHSDFYVNKLVYDEFEYIFKRENINFNSYPSTLPISFKITNTINSKMLFKLEELNIDEEPPYRYSRENDYEGYLFVNRNNEVVIYNSDYVNYIKTGYNYDKKKISQEQTYSWIGTGLQIAGSVIGGIISIASGNPISAAASVAMGTSAVASIASNINQSIANERNMESRLAQLAHQKPSILGADDIDLLGEYNGNRLHQITYSILDEYTKKSIYSLFFYTGYSSPRKAIPNLDSRVWFNFIQCEPVFTKEFLNLTPHEFISDIQVRLSAGVTKFHKYNNTYNLEQNKENLEIYLL